MAAPRRPDPPTGLEESMWRLGLGGGGLPERPGEADCLFYLRTGSCGYGEKCRFNHPRDRAVAAEGVRIGVEYPERPGQPLCQYFLKTGTCKFGATCKYHHPKQGVSVDLNIHGYPLRPGEKECSYYVKTGQCKFGVTCKFHHPQPAGPSVPTPAPPFYPPAQSPSAHTPQPYPVLHGWQPGRPPLVPGSYMQGAFSPLVLPPGLFPVPGWSPYPTSGSSVVSPGGQQTIQAGSMYGGITQQLSASAPAYISPYPLVAPLAGPSRSGPKEHNFPERPGQPECQFYMRTGDCKFGPSCRYHHPPGWSVPKTTCALSLIGLPLRPGAPTCTYYSQHGVCKFGPTCKFDHPMGILNYSPPISSADVPFVPYPAGFSTPNLTPSSSASDIHAETFTTPSNSESFSMHVQLPGNSSNGSIGSLFSTDRSVSQPFVPTTGQSSTSLSSGSSIGHGGEVGGSS